MIAGLPPLARSLAARAESLLPGAASAEAFAAALLPAVAALDAADRAYRAEIERVLPPADAREVLGTMSAFRHRVREIRARAEGEIGELYARAGRSRAAFDPLDTYTPSPVGLSHVDGVRASDLADRARAEVAALRVQANDRIMTHLGEHGAAIVAAKLARMRAFSGALHSAIVPLAGGVEHVSPVIENLTALADGWY